MQITYKQKTLSLISEQPWCNMCRAFNF